MTDTPYPLGRLPAPDPRDRNFRLAARIPPTPTRRSRYYGSVWFGDQLESAACVGFSLTHWLMTGRSGWSPEDWPTSLAFSTYRTAQTLDEWPGEDYEGTSVRAGAKALQAAGFISEYRWAWSASEVVRAVLDVGPVVVGTVWTESMFFPDAEGRIRATGMPLSGHAYLIDGAGDVDFVETPDGLLVTGWARIKNSWGPRWGRSGRAWMRIETDLEFLMRHDGEAVLLTAAAAP